MVTHKAIVGHLLSRSLLCCEGVFAEFATDYCEKELPNPHKREQSMSSCMTIEKTVTQVYEKLFDHCLPAYALQKLDLDRVLMGRLSQLASDKCEQVCRRS